MKRLQLAAPSALIAAGIVLAVLTAQPGSAQVVIGNGGGPEVQVNLGVLDHLPASGPIAGSKKLTHLKRPGDATKAAAPKTAARHKTAAKSNRPAAPAPHQAPKPAVATAHAAKPTKTASIADDAPAPAKIETAPLAPASAPTNSGTDAETTPPLPQPAAPPERVAPPPAARTAEAPPPAPSKPAAAAKQPPPAAPESTETTSTAPPAPAASAAAPTIVAGGLLAGAGDPSASSRAINVPSRNPPPPAATRDRQQTADLAAPPAATNTSGFRISFSGSNGDLSPAAQAQLTALAQMLASNTDRIILNGYASGDAASGARRVALTRVLAVRAYLVDKGVPQTRIDVRAVGTPTDGSSPERVDIAKLGH